MGFAGDTSALLKNTHLWPHGAFEPLKSAGVNLLLKQWIKNFL